MYVDHGFEAPDTPVMALEAAERLLDRGMDPDSRAATDETGFGGYTPLFSTVVSQHNFWVNHGTRWQRTGRPCALLHIGAQLRRYMGRRKA
jgi:hypothetical protein